MIFYVLDKLEHDYLPKKCILLSRNILQACQQLLPINIISGPESIASDSRVSFRVRIESKFPDITQGRPIESCLKVIATINLLTYHLKKINILEIK